MRLEWGYFGVGNRLVSGGNLGKKLQIRGGGREVRELPGGLTDVRVGQAVMVTLVQNAIFLLWVSGWPGRAGGRWQGGRHAWSAFSEVLPVLCFPAVCPLSVPSPSLMKLPPPQTTDWLPPSKSCLMQSGPFPELGP